MMVLGLLVVVLPRWCRGQVEVPPTLVSTCWLIVSFADFFFQVSVEVLGMKSSIWDTFPE